MKNTLLLALGIVVIPIGIDAQAIPSASCGISLLANLGPESPVEDVLSCAEQGFPLVQNLLGGMYATGTGVPQDYAEAVFWIRLAAEQGLPEAQYGLGAMYADGTGVPQDDVLAYMWMNLPRILGLESEAEEAIMVLAIDGKEYLRQRMIRGQINEAERLSREWIAAHPPGGN